jgi:putative membrane protein
MYLTLKALHLISMVAWFAGLFYIFRIYVYHALHRDQPGISSVFNTMAGKLLKIIMRPAAVATVTFGSALLFLSPSLLASGWIWMKLVLVTFLFIYQGVAEWTHLELRQDRYPFTEKQCRIINEVPTLILLSVVFLAILKPF